MSNPSQGRPTTRQVTRMQRLANPPAPSPSPPVQPSGPPNSNTTPLLDHNVTQRSRARNQSRPNLVPAHTEGDDHGDDSKDDNNDGDIENEDTAGESSSEGSEVSEPEVESLLSRRARKPRQSLGEVVADKGTCNGAVKALKDMNSLIDTTALDKLDNGYKLGRIKRYSTELITDIARIGESRRKNPRADVDSLSFSRLREKHMPRLGITVMPTSVKSVKDVELQLQRVDLFSHAKMYWDERNKDAHVGIVVLFQRKLRNFSTKSEAKSRVLADDLVFHATECLRRMAYLALSFLEFTISTGKNPVAVNWGNFVTYLTGSVDYTLVCSSRQLIGLEDSEVDEDSIERVVQTESDKLIHMGSLDDLLNDEAYNDLANDYGVGFSIFELKKTLPMARKIAEQTPGACLERHKPQVIGESLAMMTKLQVNELPWCLTNGLDWVFGAVWQVVKPGHIDRHSFSLETISLTAKGVKHTELFEIFMVLMFWVSQDSLKIVKFLQNTI